MKRRLITLTVFTLVLSGCQLGNMGQSQGEPTRQGDARIQQTERVPQTAEQRETNKDPRATAERLAKLATGVPNVNDATVIVFGNTAIVGIDVRAKLDRPRVGTIKYTVAEALRKDPEGAAAIVVADPDIVQRIREMNQDIQRGRPIAGFAEELADIVGRFMPQLPRDTVETRQNQDTNRTGNQR
ncbi:YhcN/YlaJ family sporulation lipoprotein [Ammoniphilus sp. CFH 90114]|uniref:YhcN/YlaJ family sporulation lipoprotein n=1 Tax=Ammoniphilus sp. CFH 90114 TaxID=2493665 RepID=UPI00100E1DA2|nr:YhcN/YlaJ family sporulation lipoprotein [Ammoniphilus sp. CFH 90114]RXT14982.1 YhcN/YlaJ family sporulation lipoprotein [Ammoniphilus sp. CFH 90114]